MGNIIMSHQKLKELVKKKLEQTGVLEEHAEIVAEVLVHADLRGVHSHVRFKWVLIFEQEIRVQEI
ncbi:Ldh family oxidoreductase [Bacillus smithii]|uniref:Ldh family oxidoreductase n=1 Tax=Bacillus smithii TaxID=1479 RepID=UPI003D206CEE